MQKISRFPFICTFYHILSLDAFYFYNYALLFLKHLSFRIRTGSSLLFQTGPLKGKHTLTRSCHSVTTVLFLSSSHSVVPVCFFCFLSLLLNYNLLLAFIRYADFPQSFLPTKGYFSKSLSSFTPLGQHPSHSLNMTVTFAVTLHAVDSSCLSGCAFSIPLLTLCLTPPLKLTYFRT